MLDEQMLQDITRKNENSGPMASEPPDSAGTSGEFRAQVLHELSLFNEGRAHQLLVR